MIFYWTMQCISCIYKNSIVYTKEVDPLQISGRNGHSGENTGYRPENENRPVKYKPAK